MAVTATPIYIQTPKSWGATATAAKTTYSDTTNAVSLMSGGTNGSAIIGISAIPRATVTATQLQLFLYDGVNVYFRGSALMGAYTMAQTTQAAPVPILDENGVPYSATNPLYIQSGWSVYIGIGVALAGGITFTARGGDY